MLSVFWHGLTKPAGPVWNAQEKKKKKKFKMNVMEMDLWRSRGRCLHAGSVFLSCAWGCCLSQQQAAWASPCFTKCPVSNG